MALVINVCERGVEVLGVRSKSTGFWGKWFWYVVDEFFLCLAHAFANGGTIFLQCLRRSIFNYASGGMLDACWPRQKYVTSEYGMEDLTVLCPPLDSPPLILRVLTDL